MTTGTCNFVSLIVKVISLEIAPSLSALATSSIDKAMLCPFNYSFYFFDTEIVVFFKIQLVEFGSSCATVSHNNLAL